MARYRVSVYLTERLIYEVEADSAEEAEEKAGTLWSEDAEPENQNTDGPDFSADKISD